MRVTAIETNANRQLEELAEQRLETARNLSQSLEDAQAQLASDRASSGNDPLKVLSGQFRDATRQIQRDTDALLDEARTAYEQGALSETDYQATLGQIAELGAQRRLQAERDLTENQQAEFQRRKSIITGIQSQIAGLNAETQAAGLRDEGDEAGALEVEYRERVRVIDSGLKDELRAEGVGAGQRAALTRLAEAERLKARSDTDRALGNLATETSEAQAATASEALATEQSNAEESIRIAKERADVVRTAAQNAEDARIEAIEASIPRLQAEYARDAANRKRANEETLADFTGTVEDRAKIVRSQNAEETQLARIHQQNLNKTAKEALETYLEAVRTNAAEIQAAQAEARQAEIEGQKALLAARESGAQSRLDTVNDDPTANTKQRVDAFRRLIDLQKEGVLQARAFTQAERDRGASASEIVSALNAEADAQAKVVSATQAQIDKLKSLRDEQLEVIKSSNDFLDYAREASELSGRDFGALDQKDAAAGLRAQQAALADVLRSQIAANAPLQERLETLRQIQAAESELQSKGERSGLDGGDRQLIGDDADKNLSEYPRKAAAAVSEIKSLDTAIRNLGGTLEEAVGKLAALFEAAGSPKDLPKVPVTVDDEGVKEARKALDDVFGADAATRILDTAARLGAQGGKGLMSALAEGVTENGGLLERAIRDEFARIDKNYLPHSDARMGGFSNLTGAGRAIPRTLAEGFTKGLPVLTSRFAAMPQPSFAIPTSRPSYYPTAASASGAVGGDTYQITVDGSRETPSSVLEGEVRRAAASVRREAKLIARRRS